VSILLLFSISIGITYIKSWQGLRACLNNPSCDPDPSLPFILFPLLGEVSFWLIALYVPIALALNPVKLFKQNRNRWIALVVIALAIWRIVVMEPFDIFRDLTYSKLITTDFYFYPVIGILIPWFIWLLLGMLERPRPALPIMIIYSLSVANASTRLWVQESLCTIISRSCEVEFSLPLFIGEIALWFIPLYALMKLISRIEISRLDYATVGRE
jgi:hypothetical protein